MRGRRGYGNDGRGVFTFRHTVTASAFNLVGDGTGSSGWNGSDALGTGADPIPPLLGPLADNGDEWVALTGPFDCNSCLRIESLSFGSPLTVYFRTASTHDYWLQERTNLTSGSWSDVNTQPLHGNGTLQGIGDPDAAASPRYYRVRVALP